MACKYCGSLNFPPSDDTSLILIACLSSQAIRRSHGVVGHHVYLTSSSDKVSSSNLDVIIFLLRSATLSSFTHSTDASFAFCRPARSDTVNPPTVLRGGRANSGSELPMSEFRNFSFSAAPSIEVDHHNLATAAAIFEPQ